MKMKRKLLLFLKAVWTEITENKGTFCVYIVLRLLVIVTLVIKLRLRKYEDALLCILTLFLLLLPQIVQVMFRVDLPSRMEIVLLCFVFSAEILGEVQAFYQRIPCWDTLLHTASGFLCAAIGFSLVEILNNKPNLKFELSPAFMALVALCFSTTIGVLWEFFEFGMDQVFLLDMQKDTVVQSISSTLLDPGKENVRIAILGIQNTFVNGEALDITGYLDIGLIDTMQDLIVNFVGAGLFSIFGYYYTAHKGGSFIEDFLIFKKPERSAGSEPPRAGQAAISTDAVS